MNPEQEIAWAGGLFEGEGCFSLVQGKYLRVSMNTTDRDVLERFVGIVGRGIVRNYRTGNDASNPLGKKRSWQWAVMGAGAVEIAEKLRPFLGERRTERLDEILSL